jgi:hypothetical protein
MGQEGNDDWMEDQPINATTDVRSSTNLTDETPGIFAQ